ncbi:MAG: hypothetical protein AAF328_06815 [Planctomycetota bacterium]
MIDLAIAREHGYCVLGNDVRLALGRVAPAAILAAIASIIRWHGRAIYDPFHDPAGANAVLNAARGLYFLRWGSWFQNETRAGGPSPKAGRSPAMRWLREVLQADSWRGRGLKSFYFSSWPRLT